MTAFLWLAKRTLPLFTIEQSDPAFAFAYRSWLSARGEGLLPSRAALQKGPMSLLCSDAEWLDLEGPPTLGRLAAVGEAIAARTDATRPRLGDLLLEDQRTVRFTGSALFQELVVEGTNSIERWHHLLLPTAGDGIRVDSLLQLVRLVASELRAAEMAREAFAPISQPLAQASRARGGVRGGADARGARQAWRGTRAG